MPALVMRCSSGPPAVPSRRIRCDLCGADCWLSLRSGESTLAAAAALGDDRVFCVPCMWQEVVRLQD